MSGKLEETNSPYAMAKLAIEIGDAMLKNLDMTLLFNADERHMAQMIISENSRYYPGGYTNLIVLKIIGYTPVGDGSPRNFYLLMIFPKQFTILDNNIVKHFECRSSNQFSGEI